MPGFEIKCNGCGTVHTFQPSPVAQSIQCPTCQWTVTAPAAPSMARPAGRSAPMARSIGTSAPDPNVETMKMPSGAAPFARPIGAAAPAASVVPPHLAQRTTSPQATPLPHAHPQPSGAADAQRADETEKAAPAYPRRSAANGVLAAVFVVMLLLLVVGGGVALYLANPDFFKSAGKKDDEKKDEDDDPLTITTDGTRWADASRNAAQIINGVKVSIEGIEYGEVYAKDSTNTVQASGQPFLQIQLHVENTTSEDVHYRSWYGNEFGGRVAKVTDDSGRVYDMLTFGDVTRIQGHVPQATLKTSNQLNDRKFADDVLIYEVADGVDLSRVKYFRLELPAAAHGGNGTYRFQIPRSRMVDGQPPDEN